MSMQMAAKPARASSTAVARAHKAVDQSIAVDEASRTGDDEVLELYLKYDEDLGVDQLGRVLTALGHLYVLLSEGDVGAEGEPNPLERQLRIRSIDSGNSLTLLFAGPAAAATGIAAAPLVVGVGAAAAVVAWLLKRRSEWHEGTKAKSEALTARAESRKTSVEATMARSRAIQEAIQIPDGRLRADTLAELEADEFFSAVFDADNVTTATLRAREIITWAV